MKNEPQTSLEVEDSVLSVAPNKELSGARSSFEAFRVLRSRNYALLFWGQLISATGTQMQVVAVAWQVYLLTLDFCATFFGAPRALLPVYARDIMHIGPQGLGLLLAAGGIGAVALMPFLGLIMRIKRQGLGVALAVIVWGLCVVAFGFFPDPLWLGILFLAGAGAADMVSVLLQGLVVQNTTPDELRGRISSVTAMFAIGGPMLGSFESGLIAGLFTPMFSVVSGGVACILAALLILMLVPNLAKVKVKRPA